MLAYTLLNLCSHTDSCMWHYLEVFPERLHGFWLNLTRMWTPLKKQLRTLCTRMTGSIKIVVKNSQQPRHLHFGLSVEGLSLPTYPGETSTDWDKSWTSFTRTKGRGPYFRISHQTSMSTATHGAVIIHCQKTLIQSTELKDLTSCCGPVPSLPWWGKVSSS